MFWRQAAEKRATSRAVVEMDELREQHAAECQALRDANASIRSIVTRLSGDLEKVQAAKENDEKSEVTFEADARNIHQLAGLLKQIDYQFAEQELVLASAISILRAARKSEVPSQAGSWFSKLTAAYAEGPK